MADSAQQLGATWWANNLDEVDREVARLATICNVRILDPGVIERVLQNDASVCGTRNPVAFEKLRTMLMMHYHAREKAAAAIGEAATAGLVKEIVESLRKSIGEQLGTPREPG